MADITDVVVDQVGQIGTMGQLITSSPSLQLALVALIVGLIALTLAYRRFSLWTRSQQFSYARPHLSRFIRTAVLPIFAIALITSINAYSHTLDLPGDVLSDPTSPRATFAMILNTINILIVGYTIATLIPIVIIKKQKGAEEAGDYVQWREMHGFPDDTNDIFHKLFEWIPPKHVPDGIDESEFAEKLKTPKGRDQLENYRTEKGVPIGSYTVKADNTFAQWQSSERSKYVSYLKSCLDGSNESGKVLHFGQADEEIYPIDTWREERRQVGYIVLVSGSNPPGHTRKKRKDLPKSATEALRMGLFAAVILGVISWWGVDLWVLATATGGFSIGIGLALQETLQNWFAYIFIRKDKIMSEGDRVKLESGYEGYIHRITPRVTYVRNALNESIATVPTRTLVNAQLVNYSKNTMLVPATVEVGVSYLNNPRQVSAILVKVGKRAMTECIDDRGRHIVRQKKCPYVLQNLPSCGCDTDIHVSIEQPVVRFNKFNDSSLDFAVWVYVRDYGSQFKAKTDMRIFMYEEFKKYDIRIPWPIRTVYQGDEKREAGEISALEKERNAVIDKYGIGDLSRGGDDE